MDEMIDYGMLVFISKHSDEIVKKFLEMDRYYFTIDIRFTNKYTGKEIVYQTDSALANDLNDKKKG